MFGIEDLEFQPSDGSAGSAGSGGTIGDASVDESVGHDVFDSDANDPDVDVVKGDVLDALVDIESEDATEDSGCPLGTKYCSGQCVSTNQVATGCAQPGCEPCVFDHASVICESSGECAIGSCVNGYEDCDGSSANGCEAALKIDTANCGSCGKPCAFAHATASCAFGACVLGGCDAGWANCDTDPATGCEVQTETDATNCGVCGLGCAFPNAQASCVGGVCQLGACLTDYLNCDSDSVNGCEAYGKTDPAHCGSCSVACSSDAGLAMSCQNGACATTSCATGTGDCDGTTANGCETNLNANAANCGSCGYACQFAHASASCVAGICHVASCDAGFGDCDANESNGCETNTGASLLHCGTCANACNPLPNAAVGCVAGKCESTCSAGFGDCDAIAPGCEAQLESDSAHCGACGRACGVQNVASIECEFGVCRSFCTLGFANCSVPVTGADDGCELSASTNNTDCGGCGNDCTLQGAGFTCGGAGHPVGLCSCSVDADCNPHGASGTCQSGGLCNCKNKACSPGEHCELDADGKKSHCSCNGGTECGAGVTCCQTPTGCINLATDPQSCGACGRACPAGFVCASSNCACSGDASCNAGSPGTCAAGKCTCSSQPCAVGKRCLADGSCG
jgi:hypothetical protein